MEETSQREAPDSEPLKPESLFPILPLTKDSTSFLSHDWLCTVSRTVDAAAVEPSNLTVEDLFCAGCESAQTTCEDSVSINGIERLLSNFPTGGNLSLEAIWPHESVENAGSSLEQFLWESAVNEDSLESYERYLRRHPVEIVPEKNFNSAN